MSGSETGVMASREPFNVGHQNSPAPSQPVLQNTRMSYNADGTTEYKHLAAISPPTYHSSTAVTGTIVNGTDAGQGGEASGINVNMVNEPLKRKRGRPRKYRPDDAMALVSAPKPPALSVNQSSGGSASPTSTSLKKVRGRPPGSSKKHQLEALGPAGVGFTPHVITVKAGEDVSSKIMSFSQHGSRAVCILSANGAISNVTLRQAATSGGTVTYEGRFEILSLSGSFLVSEHGSQWSRTGGLSVSLSGPDGRVLGGGVAGLLTAASPVQGASLQMVGRHQSQQTNWKYYPPHQSWPQAVVQWGRAAPHHGALIVNRQEAPGAHLTQAEEQPAVAVNYKAFHACRGNEKKNSYH
ncbi:AT-hook motif nuclear-localized protein 10 isoform X2 [Neltuma alba]|uniref:AT-hook motif nuclear-localized protein 10 isoform X2 n=1 Tax=Neltuma alba TaxID=207710 RepID=UPI0010A4B95F|nr:AT-hook motif nuclear-localized protein 10 isoform X2 [Prosopis alba]